MRDLLHVRVHVCAVRSAQCAGLAQVEKYDVPVRCTLSHVRCVRCTCTSYKYIIYMYILYMYIYIVHVYVRCVRTCIDASMHRYACDTRAGVLCVCVYICVCARVSDAYLIVRCMYSLVYSPLYLYLCAEEKRTHFCKTPYGIVLRCVAARTNRCRAISSLFLC